MYIVKEFVFSLLLCVYVSWTQSFHFQHASSFIPPKISFASWQLSNPCGSSLKLKTYETFRREVTKHQLITALRDYPMSYGWMHNIMTHYPTKDLCTHGDYKDFQVRNSNIF